jgi:ammonium transporter, Amt family
MIVWLIITWIREKKPTMIGALTGSIAGLATITPCAGYVKPWAAVIIGVLASIACYGAVLIKVRFEWDDALDVWGVHGVGGILGSILVGIFASRSVNGISGLIEGNVRQLGVQIAAVVIVGIYSYIVTYLIFKILNAFGPVRVSPEVEEKGLDESLHGEYAYDFDKQE